MRALVTGITGQDGSYLAEQLTEAGHNVFGMVRRRFDSPHQLVVGDLLDQDSLERCLRQVKPDVVFNLAAVTAPGAGWGAPQPPLLAETTGLGVLHLLDAMVKRTPEAKLVHASSSAIATSQYGLYGAAKRFAHDCVKGYRNRLWASNAILYSHTSPRQDPRFLAPWICATVVRIAAGLEDELVLTNVDAYRDWGWAPDYTRALALIAAQDDPDDWVVSTGRQHPVRELVELALDVVGLDWDVVRVKPGGTASTEGVLLESKHVHELGWKPETDFREMVEQLCQSQ